MKKTLALLICLAMLFTALSVNVFAAETEPTIEIVKNSISEGKTTFAVKINGNPVKGVDITVNVTGSDVAITGVSAKNFDVKGTLTSDVDYRIIEGKTLRAVGLQKDPNTGEIISVTATATTDFDISVACDIATSSTNKVVKSGTANVTADTPIIDENVTDNTVSQPSDNNYFIPYGSVFLKGEDGKYTYAEKGTNGTFSGTSGMTATKFKVPTNGLGTFGISESMKETTNPSKQFGNYAKKFQSAQYGTMIIVGDWAGFKDWYLANKGYSDAVLFEKVYTAYRTAMTKAENEGVKADYVKLTAGGNEIHVYDVPQTKVMWQSGTVLEYAVRVTNNYKEQKSYSAAAYCIKSDSSVVTSKDILTTEIGAAAN